MYLCMDACGFLYGSRDVTKECIFREKINEDNYNTYSSVKYSNVNKTMYVAMNRYGQTRKLVLRGNADLGKLASYARALTTVPHPDVHPIRHEAHHCRDAPSDLPDGGSPSGARCPMGAKKKKKKKKRKCTHADPCVKKNNKKLTGKKCSGEDGEKCSRVSNQNNKGGNKRKNGGGPKRLAGLGKNKKKGFKGKLFQGNKKGGKRTTTTTELAAISTTTTEEPIDDDYYGFDNSTHAEWDEASTASVDESSTTTTMHPD
ncbi:uncharacterized protein [Onthophagus taurus]